MYIPVVHSRGSHSGETPSVDDVASGAHAQEAMDVKKRVGLADINPDALPSSVAQKVIASINKRFKALNAMKNSYAALPKEVQTTDTKRKLDCITPAS